ncbi:MAG: transcriptional regulator [Gammaproteobacteria bacterium]|nr:transcriptional regulator [Gammaproteobacteria bacterium]
MAHTGNNAFEPDWLSPPGDTVSDLLEERNWTQAELASRLETSELFVSQLVLGEVSLTEKIAAQLNRILGGSAKFWLNREEEYRVSLAANRIAGSHSSE